MRKQSIVLFFVLFVFSLSSLPGLAQVADVAGVVLDSDTKKPLPFANIIIQGKSKGTITDLEGNFTFKNISLPSRLKISFLGYEEEEVTVDAAVSTPLKIMLRPSAEELGGVVVLSGVNPALRLIQGVMDNRQKNDHEALDQYRCKSYNKMRMEPYFKNLNPDVENLPYEALNAEYRSLSNRSFFVSESVSKRMYRRPGKVTEEVEATRMSGFQEPIFAILGGQMQSFTFYNEEFEILGIRYVSPFNRRLEKYYQYLITDTMLVNDGRDTVFTVQFKPRSDRNFNSMEGQVQIQVPDMAIRSVKAEPTENTNDDFIVRVQQLYEKVDETTWFPVQLHADMIFVKLPVGSGKVDVEGRYSYTAFLQGQVRSYLSDVEPNPEEKLRNVGKITVRIDEKAGGKDGVFWGIKRAEPLSDRDVETYRVMDSLGKRHNFDRLGRLSRDLLDNYIHFPYVDLDLNRLVRVNRLESVYVGLGGRTNDDFSKRLHLHGFGGYGFGDKVWKYGYGGELLLHRKSQLKLGGQYYFDIRESGGDRFSLDMRQTLFTGITSFRRYMISVFDQVSSTSFYVDWHPMPTWKNRFGIQRENRFVVGNPYWFNHEGVNENRFENGFTYTSVSWEGRYAPKERIVENAGRRQVVEPAYPVYRYRFEQSLDELSPDEGRFFRAELQIDHRKRSFRWGTFYHRIKAGATEGVVPYSYLFTPQANLATLGDGYIPYVVAADEFAWETMGFNQLLYQQYVSVMTRWNLEQRLYKRNNRLPELAIVGKAMAGKAPEGGTHLEIPISTPSGFIFETGIELLRLYNEIGLGVYYRPGDNIGNPFDYRWMIKLRAGI